MAEVYTEAMARAESAGIETAEPRSTDVGKFIFSALTLRANLVADKLNGGSFSATGGCFRRCLCKLRLSGGGTSIFCIQQLEK